MESLFSEGQSQGKTPEANLLPGDLQRKTSLNAGFLFTFACAKYGAEGPELLQPLWCVPANQSLP